jgi:CheY-like chemotaxis protein
MMPVRVLVVDDEPDARLLVRTWLRTLDGFEVAAEASTGLEALAAATQDIDIVVLDIGLPDIDGEELIPEIRARTGAKIVMFTAQDEDVTHFAGVADGFVRKSGDMAPLLLLLENVAASPVGASLALAMQPEAASLARHFVEAQCRAWGCEDAIDDALLITSELVTNAVIHARSNPHLLTCHVGDVVRIEVIDDSQQHGEVKVADPFDEHGRGLFIVDAISQTWGAETMRHGKRMWAEIPCLQLVSADR